MKSSFADADKDDITPPAPAQASQPPVEGGTALVPTVPSHVVPDGFFQNGDEVEGDFNKGDIRIPRLTLVANNSSLVEELKVQPGTYVYAKQIDLGKTPRGTLLKILKYYLEDLPFDETGNGPIPRKFDTEDDFRRAGFIPSREKFDLKKKGVTEAQLASDYKFAKPVCDSDWLIQGDPNNESHRSMPFDFEGAPYAIARWTLQNMAYSRVATQLFTDTQLALRKCGISGKYYSLSSKNEKVNNKWVQVPRAVLAGRNTDEFIKWIQEVVR